MVTIRGVIREKFTLRPLSAQVLASSAGREAAARADKHGQFTVSLPIPTGTISLIATAPEHTATSKEVRARLPLVEDVEILLAPAVKMLDKP